MSETVETTQRSRPASLNVGAFVLGWLFPGLGHWSLGYRRRGRLIATGVVLLFVGGLLIGGAGVINRRDAFWWYCGQCGAGPLTIVIDSWNASHPPPEDPADDPGHVYSQPSMSHVNELGTLYTTLAGMLNFIAVLDVLYLARAERRS